MDTAERAGADERSRAEQSKQSTAEGERERERERERGRAADGVETGKRGMWKRGAVRGQESMCTNGEGMRRNSCLCFTCLFVVVFFKMLLTVYRKARHANPGLHCYPYWDKNSSLIFPSLPSFLSVWGFIFQL